jgi:sterol desaturase/sphingolipid hydroxylase (fatty acid hydroxylase superfamily)
MFVDVIFSFAIPTSLIWGVKSLFKPVQGFPLGFAFIGSLWTFNLLPDETYNHGKINLLKTVEISIILDLLQYISHILAHKIWIKSHAIHHEKTNPTQIDAFYTGTSDALYQLLIPLYFTICISKPNKTTITFFGILYSNWLKFIHTQSKINFGPIFINPEYHRMHHTNPNKNFGHIYKIWDILGGTN